MLREFFLTLLGAVAVLGQTGNVTGNTTGTTGAAATTAAATTGAATTGEAAGESAENTDLDGGAIFMITSGLVLLAAMVGMILIVPRLRN